MQEVFAPQPGIVAVFRAAYNGLLHTVAVQRNMKIHWISGFMVMLVGMALEFALTARAALFFSVFLILFAEILNSALEAFVDLHIKQYHYQAKLAKDAAAAGVLVLATGVVILFADILVQYRHEILTSGDDIARTLMFGLPCVVILTWLLFATSGGLAKAVALAACIGLLVPLFQHAYDPFFSLAAGLFVVVAYHARAKHPMGLR
jgi:diacylglycerol kinase (ATP)